MQGRFDSFKSKGYNYLHIISFADNTIHAEEQEIRRG
jgi:hypothetical protein